MISSFDQRDDLKGSMHIKPSSLLFRVTNRNAINVSLSPITRM